MGFFKAAFTGISYLLGLRLETWLIDIDDDKSA